MVNPVGGTATAVSPTARFLCRELQTLGAFDQSFAQRV